MLIVWFIRCALTVAVLAAVYLVFILVRAPDKEAELTERHRRESGEHPQSDFVSRRMRAWRIRVAALVFGPPLAFVAMLVWLANV
mgnify:CR=1 FL=1